MSTGTTGLELLVSLRFRESNGGQTLYPAGLHSISLPDGRELPEALQRELYRWLRDDKAFDAVLDECAANVEPDAA